MVDIKVDAPELAVDVTTLVGLLRWRARHQPDQCAYTFLIDGETKEAHLTYAQLDRQARAIGARLQRMGATGKRALLLYAPGLEYIASFFGCLYAGVIAVPAYPPDPSRLNRTLPRLQAMVADAQATVALTTTNIKAMAEFLFSQAPDLAALQWLTTDDIAAEEAQGWEAPDVTRETLAFLQYTSGSTGTPRGVMLSHDNLLYNLRLISQCFSLAADDVGVIWLPPYHDMGLIGGILAPVYRGIFCVLMSPLDFLQRPLRWLQAISRYKGTVSGGPNFAYDLCARKVTPEQRAELDLSRWSVAFNGAEPVRAETQERFAETFASCGFRPEAFYPCYGLAEATLIVSGGSRTAPAVVQDFDGTALEQDRVMNALARGAQTQKMVGCGRNLPGQQIVIADPETLASCPPDRIGEIWVSGPSVAQGYWNRPEDTARTFRAQLADTGQGPFLRTGDLGFLDDGELFITGRLKDLIIVDGLNHYPQDIERTVEGSHWAVRPGCSAAFSIDVDGRERVVVVTEVAKRGKMADQKELDARQVSREIRRAVAAAHDLRLHDVLLLRPRTIPKTSSGKIQRHACRDDYRDGSLEVWEA